MNVIMSKSEMNTLRQADKLLRRNPDDEEAVAVARRLFHMVREATRAAESASR